MWAIKVYFIHAFVPRVLVMDPEKRLSPENFLTKLDKPIDEELVDQMHADFKQAMNMLRNMKLSRK